MEEHPEVVVSDFLELMRGYLERKIEVNEYCSRYFDLMKRRMNITDAEFWILETGYSDADDYDPVVRLEHTIEEPELRRRVAKTVLDLTSRKV